MRIRKRPAASSSGQPELHGSSNGGLPLPSVFKSSPGSQDPRSSLISSGYIIKQDHLLLAAPGNHGQLSAEAISHAAVSYAAESHDNDKNSAMKQRGEANPRAYKSMMDVQQVMHMPAHESGDDHEKGMYMKGCEELGLDKLSAARKKVRQNAMCKRSVLHQDISMQADPAMVDASDCPRKLRPLQLILSSTDLYSPTPPKLPLPLCATSSSSTTPTTPPPELLPSKFDKGASPSRLLKVSSPLRGSVIKQIADETARDEMRRPIGNEDVASSCSRSPRDRAELESCGPVPSWQGHGRPRSGRQLRRGLDDSGVNAVLRAPSLSSPSTAAGNGELRMRHLPAATKNRAHSNSPLLLSTSAACLHPTSATMMIGSTLLSAEAQRAANTLTHPSAHHMPPALPAVAPDHKSQLDFMRCRRKDGRRWRCKAEVVRAGAPFCHYHTLKKQAASLVRKLSKQMQVGEVKDSLSHADVSGTATCKRAMKRRRLRSPAQEGYGADCKIAVAKEHEEEEKHGEGEEAASEKTHVKLAGKKQWQESATLRRRWRKKCKPCIRRLHDIHDRGRPAATHGVDFFSFGGGNTSNLNEGDSPLARWRSPLPECLLNTDPYEWRSDFPYGTLTPPF